MKYWYYYSSEEFSAFIVKTPDNFDPIEFDPETGGNYCGPFKTLKQCRTEAKAKVSDDINEFRSMRFYLNQKPQNIKGRKCATK